MVRPIGGTARPRRRVAIYVYTYGGCIVCDGREKDASERYVFAIKRGGCGEKINLTRVPRCKYLFIFIFILNDGETKKCARWISDSTVL